MDWDKPLYDDLYWEIFNPDNLSDWLSLTTWEVLRKVVSDNRKRVPVSTALALRIQEKIDNVIINADANLHDTCQKIIDITTELSKVVVKTYNYLGAYNTGEINVDPAREYDLGLKLVPVNTMQVEDIQTVSLWTMLDAVSNSFIDCGLSVKRTASFVHEEMGIERLISIKFLNHDLKWVMQAFIHDATIFERSGKVGLAYMREKLKK